MLSRWELSVVAVCERQRTMPPPGGGEGGEEGKEGEGDASRRCKKGGSTVLHCTVIVDLVSLSRC